MNDEEEPTAFEQTIPVLESEPSTDEPRAKFFVVGDEFVAQSTAGDVRVGLRFTTREMRALPDTGDDVDQLFAVLGMRKDTVTFEQLNDLEIIDARILATKYFRAFAERQQMRMGEAFRSSSS